MFNGGACPALLIGDWRLISQPLTYSPLTTYHSPCVAHENKDLAMSLFENEEYQWRETFFVLFDSKKRPTAEQVKLTLARLGRHYELSDLNSDKDELFVSLTLISPDDYAAMDIICVAGEEVVEQAAELAEEMKAAAPSEEELARIRQMCRCNARFDIYHFEQMVYWDEEDDEEVMDPGSLLIVLEGLTEICDGIGIDPQTGTLV